MADYFLGQIMMTGFTFAAKGFAACNGQTMQVNQNQALFALLGTQYGGDGRQTFMLPDLRGRTPVGAGPSMDSAWQPTPYAQGAVNGVETVTLTAQQIPPHTHPLMGSSVAADQTDPGNGTFALAGANAYAPWQAAGVTLGGGPLTAAGAAPHANLQPSSVITMSIALTGIFPSRS